MIDATSGKRLVEDFIAHGLLTKDMIAKTYLEVVKNEKAGIDTLEMYMPKDEWPTPSYTDLLFYL